jgi:periplasmic copper chaperone A
MTLIRQHRFVLGLALAAFLATPALAHEIKVGDLMIEDPWTPQPPKGGDVAAGYMKITSQSKQADRLIKASAEIAATVQLHDTQMQGDVAKMIELKDGIPIPPGATIELKPKSIHVMFLQLKAPPKEGDSFKGTLTFEKAGTVDVEYDVAAPGATSN